MGKGERGVEEAIAMVRLADVGEEEKAKSKETGDKRAWLELVREGTRAPSEPAPGETLEAGDERRVLVQVKIVLPKGPNDYSLDCRTGLTCGGHKMP